MPKDPNNTVKMIGPKGKISYVSRQAAQSKHLANLGFRVAVDVLPKPPKTQSNAGQA